MQVNKFTEIISAISSFRTGFKQPLVSGGTVS